jgi:hypothetical protein
MEISLEDTICLKEEYQTISEIQWMKNFILIFKNIIIFYHLRFIKRIKLNKVNFRLNWF